VFDKLAKQLLIFIFWFIRSQLEVLIKKKSGNCKAGMICLISHLNFSNQIKIWIMLFA